MVLVAQTVAPLVLLEAVPRRRRVRQPERRGVVRRRKVPVEGHRVYDPPVRGNFAHEGSDLLEVRLFREHALPGHQRQSVLVPGVDAPPVAVLVQNGRSVRLVFLQVPIQVRLLTETPLAQWTLERFLFVMNVPNMSL